MPREVVESLETLKPDTVLGNLLQQGLEWMFFRGPTSSTMFLCDPAGLFSPQQPKPYQLKQAIPAGAHHPRSSYLRGTAMR